MNGPMAALVDTSMSNRPKAAPAPVGRGHRPDESDRGGRDERPADRLEDARSGQDLERRSRPRRAATRRANADDADEEDRPLAVPVAEAAAGQQRDRHRAEVERDQRRDRDGVDAELVHDARQGDREHRRVEGHEHRAAGDPEHRRAEQPRRGAARSQEAHDPGRPVELDEAPVGDPGRRVAGRRRRRAMRTRARRPRRATARRPCS